MFFATINIGSGKLWMLDCLIAWLLDVLVMVEEIASLNGIMVHDVRCKKEEEIMVYGSWLKGSLSLMA